MDHNPFLQKSAGAARGAVEQPQNIEWQTRAAPPTERESRLGDALERVFAAGAESLAEVVAALNAQGSRDAAGQPWSEASFQDEMRRLAG
jgi:hypothetical protein